MLGATFTEDAASRMAEFMGRVKPNYPVGISTRGTILKFLGVAVDDGKQMPRLVLIDARGSMRASFGWQDPVFQDPVQQEARIRQAIQGIANAKRPAR